MKRRPKLRKQLLNTDGSSMISVLVAFIILLIGIAGFSKAVTTANDMVRRAEMLNAATDEVLTKYFYPTYTSTPANSTTLTEVYEGKEPNGPLAFKLHGKLMEENYPVNITQPGTTETESMTYSMYFYK